MTPARGGGVLAVVSRDDPFPVEVVRDLLGICRALYATFKKMGPAHDRQRSEVQVIGEKLQRALEKAKKGHPGGWDQNSAWGMALEAYQQLTPLIDVYLPAKQLVDATGERLARRR